MRRAWICLALVVSWAPVSAQPVDPPSAEDMSIQAFLQAVEASVSALDRQRWSDLLSPTADRDEGLAFFDSTVPEGVTRAVVKERDRAPLAGTLPGEGFRLIAEVFFESGPRGRIATWTLDIRKLRGEAETRQPWRVAAIEVTSSVDGLHRLTLDRTKQFAAQNLVLRSVDFEVRLPAGHVFVAETPDGVTALVLLGEGSILFSPKPKEERGQVRIFAGAETLDTPFTAAFVRVNPNEFSQAPNDSMLRPLAAVDARAFRRAQQVFDDELRNSFSLDLSDLSRDTWSLLPQSGDFVAEVRTRRYEKLTFARSSAEPEDVSLFQRARKRNIALYASEQKLAVRGRFYNEDDLVEYDVLEYAIDAAYLPDREWMEGRARLKLRVRAFVLGAITLKLADSLTVNAIVSEELGRLLFLRVTNQNAVVINLPSPATRDDELTLHVSYQGRVEDQNINDDAVSVEADRRGDDQSGGQPDELPLVAAEGNWLFSNRTQWYPQGQVTDYATAVLRITVPAEYTVVASGVQASGSPVVVGMQTPGQPPRTMFTFVAPQPVRYLSMIVSRMQRVDAATVALDIVVPEKITIVGSNGSLGAQLKALANPPVGARNTVALTVDANRRQDSRGREAMTTLAEILRLYASIIGDAPYDALNVAMVEANLPGGHAPGYVAVINNPLPTTPFTWRNDPANFGSFPEFFLAHELAHQWFGQAVGWKNYHEQWLSEGFAQYMAALFARDRRGEDAFRDILRQFRRWSLEQSDEGPIHLGYRLGHIKSEGRVFRALVYNKGALVLHMLRRLVGDEAFFAGVRRYYREHRFAKAGTDDLRVAMEAESGRDLSRFFERWVFDSGIPRLRYSAAVGADEVTVRIEQIGEVYDLPVTVTLQQADGKVHEEVVVLGEAVTEARIRTSGAVRAVELNQDHAALAQVERSRNASVH
jgi:Peptidase family M1 domain